jgi:hypothetical protein
VAPDCSFIMSLAIATVRRDSRRSLSPRRFVSELFAGLQKQRLQLICRQPGSENIHQLGEAACNLLK